MESTDINIQLTLRELNKVLASLGKEPYKDVFQLIHNIQEQAQEQLADQNNSSYNGQVGEKEQIINTT